MFTDVARYVPGKQTLANPLIGSDQHAVILVPVDGENHHVKLFYSKSPIENCSCLTKITSEVYSPFPIFLSIVAAPG